MSCVFSLQLFDGVGTAVHRHSGEDDLMLAGVVRRKELPRWQSCW